VAEVLEEELLLWHQPNRCHHLVIDATKLLLKP
jgi:hypothetical protein